MQNQAAIWFSLLIFMVFFWLVIESPSVALLVMVFVSSLSAFMMSNFMGGWDVPVFVFVLSFMGGMFVLFGMVVMSFPKDHDLVLIPSNKLLGPSIIMFLLIPVEEMWMYPQLPWCQQIPLWPYLISFIFCIFILFLSLFLIDSLIGKGMNGAFFD